MPGGRDGGNAIELVLDSRWEALNEAHTNVVPGFPPGRGEQVGRGSRVPDVGARDGLFDGGALHAGNAEPGRAVRLVTDRHCRGILPREAKILLIFCRSPSDMQVDAAS